MIHILDRVAQHTDARVDSPLIEDHVSHTVVRFLDEGSLLGVSLGHERIGRDRLIHLALLGIRVAHADLRLRDQLSGGLLDQAPEPLDLHRFQLFLRHPGKIIPAHQPSVPFDRLIVSPEGEVTLRHLEHGPV